MFVKMADNIEERLHILNEKAKFHLSEYNRLQGEIKKAKEQKREINRTVPAPRTAQASTRKKREIDLLVSILHAEKRGLTTSELCEFMNESLENVGIKYDSNTFAGRFKDAIDKDPRFVVEKGYVCNGRSTSRFIAIDKEGKFLI